LTEAISFKMDDGKIKIIQIITRLNIGGPASHVALLADKLDKSKFEQYVVCGQVGEHEGDMRYIVEERGIEPLIIPELGREISLLRDARALLKLYRLMRRIHPHIVHTHTAKAGFLGRIAAWLAHVPVRIHTFHGHIFHDYFGTQKTRLFIHLERFCARLSSRIVAISPKLKEEMVHNYRIASESKVVVVPLGLDLRPLTVPPEPERLVGFEQYKFPGEKVIGIVGRMVAIKNHRLFIEAAAHVLRQRNDVHFLIVGDGERRGAVERQIADLGLQDYVTLTGWIKDMGVVLSLIDILALTSDNEGTPVSIIEAMSAGVPVVSTNVGGVSDVLGNGKYGITVTPNNPEAFAEALLGVLRGDVQNIAIARQAALEHYDVLRLVKDISLLYISSLHKY
jgi:glycosyltransferase involved in cell wall biosynthesis